MRVVFRGPEELAPAFDAANHKLVGKEGIIVYGISEDVFCYPDDLNSDMVWVAFEGDRIGLLNRADLQTQRSAREICRASKLPDAVPGVHSCWIGYLLLDSATLFFVESHFTNTIIK